MERSKLNELIKEKNERLERDTLRDAERIIEAIVTEQRKVAAAEQHIADLRKDLKALTVSQLDVDQLLGGE